MFKRAGIPCFALYATLVTAPAVALELRDPMQPPAAAEPVTEAEPAFDRAAYRLRAIKIEAHRRSAMINGQVVAEGEQIDGARVLKIEPRAVVIAIGKQTLSLSLLKHDIKHRPLAPR